MSLPKPRLSVVCLAALLLSACATTEFRDLGGDTYELYRFSDACAAGNPETVLATLRAEAAKFCAARKERPVEVSTETQFGIPVIRCADATLKFRCSP